MDNTQSKASEQRVLWNGSGGRAWVESQEVLDQMLRPFEDILVDAVGVGTAGRVLDVGCGTGGTTVAIARRIGQKGSCTGLDISEPMLTAARARAARESTPPTFVLADAQTHAFEPASFDTIVSRFGVMFFDDPVKAFANLRRAATESARLCFVAWRSPAENAFQTTAERAAAEFLPNLALRRADEPGQFGLADRDRVRQILEVSGWSEVDIQPIDVPCSMAERDLLPYVTRLGPIGRILPELSEQVRAKVIDKLREAFEPYVHGAEVRFVGACWLVSGSGANRKR